MQLFTATQETLDRFASMEPAGPGVTVLVHVVPFHSSESVP